MSNNYVYRITNIKLNKHYYGKRSCKILPALDLGIRYFSSSKDKNFLKDQKENPSHYKYKIIREFISSEEACEFEIRLHKRFQVGTNSNFYNIVTQTHTAFDSTGKCAMEDKFGNRMMLSKEDQRFLSGEYKTVKCGFVSKGRIFTTEHRENLSKSSKGKKKSKEHVEKSKKTKDLLGLQKGKDHPRFKYYYQTPWGTFDSPKSLEPNLTMSRMKNFCINNSRIFTEKVLFGCELLKEKFTTEDVGKTYKELGFSVKSC